MLKTIENWVWRGSFDPIAERLEVYTPEGNDDIVTVAARTIGELSQTMESLQSALHRRRATAEGRGGGVDTAALDEEVRRIVRSLLPSLDALDRIIEFGEGFDEENERFQNWFRTVRALRARLMKTLEGLGLVPISAVGAQVDLEVHDVVAVVPAGEYPPGTVVSEQVKGYYFRGRLLRDARVVVAQ